MSAGLGQLTCLIAATFHVDTVNVDKRCGDDEPVVVIAIISTANDWPKREVGL